MQRTTRVLALVALLAPAGLQAQETDRFRLAVAGGPTLNDLEVGGIIWLAAASLEWRPTSRPLVLDSSVRYLTFTAAEREHYPLVEISAQWELGAGGVRPFVGGGGGLGWRVRPSDTDSYTSTHLVAGLRASLGSRVGLRAEGRLRSREPLGDVTLGVSWGLGRR